jgi:hypothetical protein
MSRKILKKRTLASKKTLQTQRKKALEEIERLAEHALASGPATPWTAQDKEGILRRLREKYGNRNGSKS